ncbi:transmembrane channel-like protein 3 [Acropora millepora]|uniref:transmembrane channel-like protein 3 n=1 Tax=Acropora millepora TaxID=45264 RepID=UPI001CF3A1AF|nr:transmembrane channel-like protein 3 [Acropora millepora]
MDECLLLLSKYWTLLSDPPQEQILEAVEQGKTTNKKLLIVLRVCANVLVLGVLSASAYLIYLVLKRSDDREKEGRTPTVLEQYEV